MKVLEKAERSSVACLVDVGGGRIAGAGSSGIAVWSASSGLVDLSAPDAATSPRGPVTSLVRIWGDRLAAGHDSGALSLWKLGPDALTPAGQLDAVHSGAVLVLAVAAARRTSGDSGAHPRLLASGGADAMIRLWDADGSAGPRALIQLKGHSGPISGLSYLQSGMLVSCALDGSLRVWGATAIDSAAGFGASCRCLVVMNGAVPGGARALCASTDGDVIVGSTSGALLQWHWDASGRKLVPKPLPEITSRLHSGRGPVVAALASPDGGLVASADEASSELRLWLTAPSWDGLDGVWAPAPGGSAACPPFVLVRGRVGGHKPASLPAETQPLFSPAFFRSAPWPFPLQASIPARSLPLQRRSPLPRCEEMLEVCSFCAS